MNTKIKMLGRLSSLFSRTFSSNLSRLIQRERDLLHNKQSIPEELVDYIKTQGFKLDDPADTFYFVLKRSIGKKELEITASTSDIYDENNSKAIDFEVCVKNPEVTRKLSIICKSIKSEITVTEVMIKEDRSFIPLGIAPISKNDMFTIYSIGAFLPETQSEIKQYLHSLGIDNQFSEFLQDFTEYKAYRSYDQFLREFKDILSS